MPANDRLPVAAATLSLLAAAADARPVLCIVDDAQWIDSLSAESLVFAARRLRAEGVLLLIGVRAEDPGAARFANVLHRELHLSGLDAEAARALARHQRRTGLHDVVVDRVLATAAGNPLALLELPSALSDGERHGQTPDHKPVAAWVLRSSRHSWGASGGSRSRLRARCMSLPPMTFRCCR